MIPLNKKISLTKIDGLFFLTLFLIYAFLGFFGYGNDNDTYGMIFSGRDMWLLGDYRYSRGPGNFIPEMIIGGASLLGGHVLTNLISAILGTASLYFFWKLIGDVFTSFNAKLITAIIALNPYFTIASSSSMDYVYSLFFGLLGLRFLKKRYVFFAAILISFSASSRLSSLLAFGIIYLYYFYIHYSENNFKEMSRLFLSGILVCFLTILFFVPSYIAANYTFAFLGYGIGDWTFFGHLSRFVYKNIYLFGLLPFLFLTIQTGWKMLRKEVQFPLKTEIYTGLAIVLCSELLFFKIPCEISYLLPLLFVFIPLFVLVCQPKKNTMYLLLFVTFSGSFLINPDFLDRKYDNTGQEAIGADVGLFLRPGVVIDDVLKREKSRVKYWRE